MKTENNYGKRLTGALLAGILALLVTTALLLGLSHYRALAKPAGDSRMNGVAVHKEVNTTDAQPGDILVYTITINSDASSQANTQMTDVLQDELIYLSSGLAGPGTLTFSDQALKWEWATFGWGQNATITMSAQISPTIDCTTLVNTARVTDTNSTDIESSVTTIVGADDSLTVTKSIEPTGMVEPGEYVTYTIELVNNGTASVSNIDLTDVLTPTLIYADGSLELIGPGTADFASGVVTWTGTLGGWGQRTQLSFSAQVRPDQPSESWITNTVTINAPCQLVTDSVSTYVYQGQPALTANKIAMPEQVRPGESLMYAIHLTNEGDGDADAVTLVDELPPEITGLNGVTPTVGNYEHLNGVITWTGSLAPADHVVITLSTDVSSTLSHDTYFTNTVTITGTGHEIQASAEARVVDIFFHYLPLVLHNWPPRYYLPIVMRGFPPIPTLNPIPTPETNQYTVSWSINATGFDRFVLQESTDAGFGTLTNQWLLPPNQLSLYLSSQDYNTTYYYRVRADDDDYWGEGPWSNVESVTTADYYFDDFSDPNSGWPRVHKMVIKDTDSEYHLDYENGKYRIRVDPGGPDIWFHQPDALAPYRPNTDKYCVETKVRIFKGEDPYEPWDYFPYWANGGLVFGANESNTRLYALCMSVGAEGFGWFVVKNPEYQYPYKGCNYVQGSVGGQDAGAISAGWHTFQVAVDGDRATVYINGTRKGSWNMSGLSGTTRVGLIAGDYEITPVDFRFDNFKVVPNSDCGY